MFSLTKEIKDVIKHGDLIIELAIKDLKVRYRRPLFGFLWTVLTPLFLVVIYKIVFSDFLNITVKNYPFFIYLMSSLFTWNYFQNSISNATTSILDSKNLVSKLSFPRILIPVSVILANLINFLPSVLVMLIFVWCFRIGITFYTILLPAVILLHTILIVGLGLLTAGLYVKFRDFKYIVGVLLTGLFFLTPSFYQIEFAINFPVKIFSKLYLLNPFVGILNLYRITLFKGFWENLPSQVTIFNTAIIPIVSSIISFFIGIYVFRRCEKTFSDYITI